MKDAKLKKAKHLGTYSLIIDLSSSFPDVLRARVIFITMQIPVAGVEWSFSNTCSIAILNVEK